MQAAFVYTVCSAVIIDCVHTPFTIFDNVSHERELVSCVRVYIKGGPTIKISLATPLALINNKCKDAGVDDCPCFTTFIDMIPIDRKITNFSLHLFVYFLVTIISNIGELTSGTSKERMTTNIILWVPHPLINEMFICQ